MKVKGEHSEMGQEQLQAVADLFSVLSEPARLRILQVLQRGPTTVGQIMEQSGLKQANASKHLGILYQAGVLGRDKEGTAVRYHIRLPLIFDLCALVCTSLHEHAATRAKQLKM